MIDFLKFFKLGKEKHNNDEDNTIEEYISKDDKGVTKTETFYPFIIYSNKDNQTIGEIELTDEQSYKLNEINRRDGVYRQDIVFLRKWDKYVDK